jgi:hypothetical protein
MINTAGRRCERMEVFKQTLRVTPVKHQLFLSSAKMINTAARRRQRLKVAKPTLTLRERPVTAPGRLLPLHSSKRGEERGLCKTNFSPAQSRPPFRDGSVPLASTWKFAE